jgi:hypothetical protein
MARIARLVAIGILLIGSVSSTGCLHTWTQTYQDYPPEAALPAYSQHQGDPTDG